MTAGRYANVIRNVRLLLEAAAEPTRRLAYLEEIYFGENDPETDVSRPYVWVHLAQESVAERWSAARNQKDSELRIVVEVNLDIEDPEEPYGVAGAMPKLGVLTMLEDVANAIDEAGLGNGSDGKPATVDYNLSVQTVRNVEGSTWKGELLIVARLRFLAGDR
jgi:hypothetical protein